MLPAVIEFLTLLPLTLPAPAEPARVDLDLSLAERAIVGRITVAESEDYFGAVLLSTSPDLAHFLVNLPPLLADSIVLGFGRAENGVLQIEGPQAVHPPITIYGQAVVFDEAVDASGIEKLDLRGGQ
jgi:hypothetical protein